MFNEETKIVLDWLQNYDVALITAFKKENTLYDNVRYNGHLRNRLWGNGYRGSGNGILPIDDGLLEIDGLNKVIPYLLVVNIRNYTNFFSTLFALSTFYKQDSFIYKPQGVPTTYSIKTSDKETDEYTVVDDFPTKVQTFIQNRIKNATYAVSHKTTLLATYEQNTISPCLQNHIETTYSSSVEQPSGHRTFEQLKRRAGLYTDEQTGEVVNIKEELSQTNPLFDLLEDWDLFCRYKHRIVLDKTPDEWVGPKSFSHHPWPIKRHFFYEESSDRTNLVEIVDKEYLKKHLTGQ